MKRRASSGSRTPTAPREFHRPPSHRASSSSPGSSDSCELAARSPFRRWRNCRPKPPWIKRTAVWAASSRPLPSRSRSGASHRSARLGLNSTRAERNWPDALVKRLEVVAQIFANALARKRADQVLRENEQRMTLAADAAHFGVWVWNIAPNQVWGSERWQGLFGFVAGKDVSFEAVIERIHPDDRETVEREVRHALANRSDYAGEFRAVLPDGTLRWIASRGRGYADANGTPIRMVGAAIDITERRQSEAALLRQRAELAHLSRVAMLGELSGSMAHELNQPLTAILSNAQAAQRFLAADQADLGRSARHPGGYRLRGQTRGRNHPPPAPAAQERGSATSAAQRERSGPGSPQARAQ